MAKNKKMTKAQKIWTAVGLSAVIGVFKAVGLVLSYVVYIIGSYNRIGSIELTPDGNAQHEKVSIGSNYKAITYNIGFGAYSQDYTFFMDDGYDDEGNLITGYYSKGRSKDEILYNINGSSNIVKNEDSDFVLLQEVDVHSTRSYYVDEDKIYRGKLNEGYMHSFAKNFHTAFLPYPLYDMHGSVQSGLSTYSKYKITHSERKEYTVATDFSKFFDLDRCFQVNKIEVDNGKILYLVNNHMSAYDEGGKIRKIQMEELNAFLNKVKEEGNYCIVSGDFNHDLLVNNPKFDYNDSTNRPFGMTKKKPDWLSYLFDENHNSPITSGFTVYGSDNNPTCRNNNITWIEGETFVASVDGFIVSDNIEVTSIKTIRTINPKTNIEGFAYSDHEPVSLEFKLK
ncbi:MAG: endonuclease/exonuclease/phosphatase family protein [Bacilli bacterium]|nr:endonuclease/exonuclease/phosphatase family protein [Bacilli bacterium]MBR1582025.1 endonuclease/exonuclease/phosphatase family protein [Bacilli bacterium]